MSKILKIFIISLSFVFSFLQGHNAWAEAHREHGAHQHGAAKMGISFEGSKGQITLELASEGIYGFEYAPVKAADKKRQHDGLEKLEKNISSLVSFSSELKCVFKKEKLVVDQHEGGKHSDIDASFSVLCEKSPLGTQITFNIQKYFPKLKDVDVQIIVDDFQKSVEAKSDGSQVELKK